MPRTNGALPHPSMRTSLLSSSYLNGPTRAVLGEEEEFVPDIVSRSK